MKYRLIRYTIYQNSDKRDVNPTNRLYDSEMDAIDACEFFKRKYPHVPTDTFMYQWGYEPEG